METKSEQKLKELVDAVAKEKVAESTPHIPGAKTSFGKVPWTRTAFEAKFSKITFTPEETIPITWNGLRYQLIADMETSVPFPIKQIYDEWRKNQRIGHKSVTLTDGTVINLVGVGALTAEDS